MNPVLLLQRKRDGMPLTRPEIRFLIEGYVNGQIPDYQMSALAMAIYFQGMNGEERGALTEAMLQSGATLRRSGPGIRVDKHSTGGIGDKTSLILAPLLACCGFQVPMLSGRGLGATGGTLDKLESIPGFRTDLSAGQIDAILERIGCVITGQTADLVPADKQLYALRDVTATVPSLPLITASIMSKKLAENLDALVLDVKWGSGAFMKSLSAARLLAEALTDVGERTGLKTVALITDMNQPLGRMVGNAVEVLESIDALSGRGPSDLLEVTLVLGEELLLLTNKAESRSAARQLLQGELESGRALERFWQMVTAQGGDPEVVFEVAPDSEITAARAGYVHAIDCERLGYAVIALGGGRQHLGQRIDHGVGLEMQVRLGDRVEHGQPLVRLFSRTHGVREAIELIRTAININDIPPGLTPLIQRL